MSRPPRGLTVVSSIGCALAAAIWLAVWLHQYHSHGRTSVNEMRLVIGLTWMDAAKILPFALLLLLPGVEVVVARAGDDRQVPARTGPARGLGRASQACLVVAAVGGARDFWTFPLGSYRETFESRGDEVPVQFLGCVLAGVLLVVLTVVVRRAANGAWVALLLLASGVLTSSLWTPVLLWPVISWTLFAAWLWWSASRQQEAVTTA